MRTDVRTSSSLPATAAGARRRPEAQVVLTALEPALPALCALLALCSFWLWARAIGDVNPREINDLGLVSVLPTQVLFAFVLLTVSFCLLLHRRPLHTPTAVLHLGLLVLMLYGMTSFIEEVPRFAVSWRHAGVADYIVQHGSLNAGIAQWLIGKGLAPDNYIASQGTVLGRAGRVYVQREGDDIWIGGGVAKCVDGTITLPD